MDPNWFLKSSEFLVKLENYTVFKNYQKSLIFTNFFAESCKLSPVHTNVEFWHENSNNLSLNILKK